MPCPARLTPSEPSRNGHTEIIDVDGDTLTVHEYDGDKLVKSVEGVMVDGRAVLDTSYYDERGKVSQTIHAEMARLETKNGWTGAVMNRSVTWYKDGQVERTLGDEMYLRTNNTGSPTMSLSGNDFSRMTGKLDGDSDTLILKLTGEEHKLSYHARHSGVLRQQAAGQEYRHRPVGPFYTEIQPPRRGCGGHGAHVHPRDFPRHHAVRVQPRV